MWGRDDQFQKISYARRYVNEIPASELVEVAGKHIPTEDSPKQVAAAIIDHLESAGGGRVQGITFGSADWAGNANLLVIERIDQ